MDTTERKASKYDLFRYNRMSAYTFEHTASQHHSITASFGCCESCILRYIIIYNIYYILLYRLFSYKLKLKSLKLIFPYDAVML